MENQMKNKKSTNKITKTDKTKIIDFLKQACKDQSRDSDADYELEYGYRNVNIQDKTLSGIQNGVFKEADDNGCNWITPQKQLHMTVNSEKFASGQAMSKMLKDNNCELHAKLTTNANDYSWGSWIAVPMYIKCDGTNVQPSADGKCHVSLMKLTIEEAQLDRLVKDETQGVQDIHAKKKALNKARTEDGTDSVKYQFINAEWTQLIRNNPDKATYDNLIPTEIQRCKDIVTDFLVKEAQTTSDITIKAINSHHHHHSHKAAFVEMHSHQHDNDNMLHPVSYDDGISGALSHL